MKRKAFDDAKGFRERWVVLSLEDVERQAETLERALQRALELVREDDNMRPELLSAFSSLRRTSTQTADLVGSGCVHNDASSCPWCGDPAEVRYVDTRVKTEQCFNQILVMFERELPRVLGTTLVRGLVESCVHDGCLWMRNAVIQRLSAFSASLGLVVADLFVAQVLRFPLKKSYMNRGDVCALFERLQVYRPKTRFIRAQFPGLRWQSSLSFAERGLACWGTSEDLSMDAITDYFTEPERMRASMEMRDRQWITDVWLPATLDRAEGLTPFALREAFASVRRECTQFPASLAVAVLREFRATRVLDLNASWGDRLLASMASGVQSYVGFDANQELEHGHREMIKQFVPVDALRPRERRRFRLFYEPFELASLPANLGVDLVFCSPNSEVYQANADEPLDWLTQSLFPSLEKCWHALEPSGHMVLDLADTDNAEPSVLWSAGYLSCCRFLGARGALGAQLRPLWVFQKADNRARSQASEARRRLAKYYPTVVKRLDWRVD